MSSGTVHIHCEVLMKAFRDTYISGDKWLKVLYKYIFYNKCIMADLLNN
jgi:bifunctional pyridoxal-dependent enzyme with beta-cystathionase and maltose regulon repressor activities